MARARDPLLAQARSDASLRYGQSLADLLSARHTNYHEYVNSSETAHQVARAQRQAAKQSIPALKRIYDEADATRQAAAQQIDAAVNVTQAPHSALAMALLGERGAAEQNMADERAAAESDAVRAGRDAVSGEAYAKSNALQTFRANRADLLEQTRGVHAQIGAETVARLGDLQGAQQDQANKDRQYNLDLAKTLGVNPLTGKPMHKPRSRAEEVQVRKDTASATEEIKRARVWINQLRSKGGDDKTIVQLLTQGGSLPTTIQYQGSNAKGEKVRKVRTRDIPVEKFSPDFVRAALELEDLNYVSDSTLHTLRVTHDVRVPKEWLPPTKGQFGPH